MSKSTDNQSESLEMKPQSVGEELYLVHLKRHAREEPDEDDYDHEVPRKRTHSAGEELWEVHLRRSQGEFEDKDEKQAETSSKGKTRTSNKKLPESPQTSCRYSLRSRSKDLKSQ